MQRASSTTPRRSALALSIAAAAMLAACGGGGSDAGNTAGTVAIDDLTATAYAANATQIGSDTASVADGAMLAAQSLVASGAGVSIRAGSATADAVALVSSAKACPGGGTATVSITGGTTASQLNGQLDAGEVYAIVFAACTGAGGTGQLDGTMTMTVETATGDSANGTLDVSLTARALTLALPRGSVTLDGTTDRQLTVATDSDGTVHETSHFVSPSLTLVTRYDARTSTFTLSAADITRTATLVGGVIQSSTVAGTHTLSAVLPNRSFSYTVATTGGVTTYAADGKPTAGAWTITLANAIIDVTVANGTATIAIDLNKDGTIDRTITVPVATLVGDAG
jgi:hypothetical protein